MGVDGLFTCVCTCMYVSDPLTNVHLSYIMLQKEMTALEEKEGR